MSYLAKYQTKKAELEAQKASEAVRARKKEAEQQNLRDLALAEFTEKIKASPLLNTMATYIVNKTLTDFTERLVCTWSFQVLEYYDGGDYGYHAECKDPNCDLKQVISSIVTGEGVKYTRDDVVVIKNGKEQIACQELKSRVEKLLVSKIKGEFYFSINLNTYTNTIKIEFQLEKKAPDRNISRYSQGEIISWTVKIIGGILIAVFIAIVIVTQTNDTTHYSEGWALLGGTAGLFIGFFLCCFDFDLQ